MKNLKILNEIELSQIVGGMTDEHGRNSLEEDVKKAAEVVAYGTVGLAMCTCACLAVSGAIKVAKFINRIKFRKNVLSRLDKIESKLGE